MREVLEPAGHDVLLAPSCAAARAAFDERSGDVDLVLADLLLPDGSGADLVADLAARSPRLRALLMTGKGAEEIGGDPTWRSRGGLIPKPFDVGELLRRVDELLR